MRPVIRRTALAALSLSLLGCASHIAAVKNAVGLSSTPDTAKAQLPTPAKGLANGSGIAPTDVLTAVHQAQALRRSGDFQAAARTLSQLVLVAPDDPDVMGEYGKTLVAMGRNDDALAFLERGIELRPGDWTLYSARGVAFDQEGEYKSAQSAYDRALALQPGEPTVLSNNALSHMQTGDLETAESLLLRAAQSGGDNPRIASNLTLLQSLKAARAQTAGAALAQNTPIPSAPAAPAATQEAASAPPSASPTTLITQKAIPAPAAVPVAMAAPIPATPQANPPLAGQTALRINPAALLNRLPNRNEPAPTLIAPGPVAAPAVAATPASAAQNPGQAEAKPATPARPQVSVLTAKPAASHSLQALQADPTVMVQAVPKDDRAGAVKRVAAAARPREITTALLRPTLSGR